MVQCEMCGVETGTPKRVKIEGAELQVCADCAEFGTEVRQEATTQSSTKYSTSSGGPSATSSGGGGGTRSKGRRRDMFDRMETLAADYDERIRAAREAAGLNQAELAERIHEKASLVRKLERGDMRPSDEVQRKLERLLDITLTEEDGGDEEWSSANAGGGLTLGDMVKRKD